MTRQYNNRGQQINIETVQGNVVVQKSTRSNSEWTLLQEVDREVESRLDQSLHNAALLNLGKQPQPEQVKRIWDAEVKIGAKPPEPLAPDVSILEVFERSDIAGKLLILGDPGAGKTTTMLDLAQVLVDKAQQDANDPIPVLINLSGWQEPRQSMPDWLVEELKSKYGVRKDIGKQWLQEKHLLPLLDGLDEVKPEHQEACVQAINQWLGSDRRPSSVVVCSRREEYANSQTQLHLNGAILLQALTDEQIQDYLNKVNRTELWQVLQQDAVLLDLMKTPLLLSITVLSYQALSLQQWHQLTSTQERLNLLLDAYIQTMLDRDLQDPTMQKRGWLSKSYRKHKPPTAAQTRHWLTFLAQQLQRESQTEFLIEKMQPSWLITSRQISFAEFVYETTETSQPRSGLRKLIARWYIRVSINMDMQTAMRELAHCEHLLLSSKQVIAHWLIVFLSSYLIAQLLFCLAGDPNPGFPGLCIGILSAWNGKIKPTETLSWSFKKMKKALRSGWIGLLLFGGLAVFGGLLSVLIGWFLVGFNGLVTEMSSELLEPSDLLDFLLDLLGFMFGSWLIGSIIAELLLSDSDDGFISWSHRMKRSLDESGLYPPVESVSFLGLSSAEKENKRSPNQGIWKSAINALLTAMIFGLISGLTAVHLKLSAGLDIGMTFGLCFGGRAFIQHFVLRLMLYQNRSIPWNYARFLNYCTDRLLLQRVGGRYRFVHKLLQERFAELGE